MTHTYEQPPAERDPSRNPEILHLSDDLRFAMDAAIAIGDRIYASWQTGLSVSTKADNTLVSQIEIETNHWFNGHVVETYGDNVAIHGEEVPFTAKVAPAPGDVRYTWTLDSGDGSGELAATYRDRNTGDPINPKRPTPANTDLELIQEHERTTCTGIGLIKDNQVWLGVSYNPFQKRLVIADRDLGGTFVVDPTTPWDMAGTGYRTHVTEEPLVLGNRAWDHATWDGGAIDPAPFQQAMGSSPMNHYSAIDQAVEVALGNSHAALFAGNTAYDIVPALAIVNFAGGVAFDAQGHTLDPNAMPDVLPHGVIYSDRVNQLTIKDALMTGVMPPPRETLCVGNYDGKQFVITLDDHLGGIPLSQSAESIVTYAHDEAGVLQPDTIVVHAFGRRQREHISWMDIRRLHKQTRKLGVPEWDFEGTRRASQSTIIGIAKIPRYDQLVEVGVDAHKTTVFASEVVIGALRNLVKDKLYKSIDRQT